MRETHLEAIKTGRSVKIARMCVSVLSYEGAYPDPYGTSDMLYCIPMEEGYDGKNALVEERTKAVSILHRGAYSTLIESTKALTEYGKEKNLSPTGPLRLIWLEGPPVHGAAEEKYLTQIAIPHRKKNLNSVEIGSIILSDRSIAFFDQQLVDLQFVLNAFAR